MAFDFTLILTLLTLASALVLIIDRLFFYAKRREKTLQVEFSELVKLAERKVNKTNLKQIRQKAEPRLVETARSFFPVLFIVLVIRSFIFEPYQIPSGSMLPTLRVGDFILVNKFSYGLRLPVLNTRFAGRLKPERGEIMVFRAPFDPANNYIKRVIGLPGDTITVKGDELLINDKRIPLGMVKPATFDTPAVYTESLKKHPHYIHPMPRELEGEQSWKVPDDHFFVMGDNRPNSYDSRFWGFVHDDLVVGKAVYIWMTWESWFSLPGFSRTGAIDKLTQ